MSFKAIRSLKSLSQENFDDIREKILDGLRRLFKEMDDEARFGRWQLERYQEVFTSILMELALLDDYFYLKGGLVEHLKQAAVEIEADLREFWRTRGRQDEVDDGKEPTASTEAQPDPFKNAAPTPCEQGGRAMQVEPRDTGKSDVGPANPVALPSYASPYLAYMINATLDIGPDITKQRKKEVRHYVESHWPTDTLGPGSDHLRDVMATFIRHPAAHVVKP